MDSVAFKWGKTPEEFKALMPEDRERMAALTIMDGWIEMVAGDI